MNNWRDVAGSALLRSWTFFCEDVPSFTRRDRDPIAFLSKALDAVQEMRSAVVYMQTTLLNYENQLEEMKQRERELLAKLDEVVKDGDEG